MAERYSPPSILFFGFGYVANYLASFFQQQGWKMYATRRLVKKEKITSRQGIPTNMWHAGKTIDKELKKIINESTHWIISIPPEEGKAGPFFKEKVNPVALQHIIYFSSTAVYGDKKGAWVDETSETNPISSGGIARLKAENQWIKWAKEHKVKLTIFRTSGIYGPGRNILQRLKEQYLPPIEETNMPALSRIHITDIIRLVGAYLAGEKAFHKVDVVNIFNLADSLPATYNETLLYMYKLINSKAPEAQPLASKIFSPTLRQFMQESKKVNGQKILEVTGLNLLYKTYKEGFSSFTIQTRGKTNA